MQRTASLMNQPRYDQRRNLKPGTIQNVLKLGQPQKNQNEPLSILECKEYQDVYNTGNKTRMRDEGMDNLAASGDDFFSPCVFFHACLAWPHKILTRKRKQKANLESHISLGSSAETFLETL